MTTSSTGERALAIITGLAFTTGGLTILLGPVLLTPLAWASYHVLTILTVFGTIAAGHLTKTAWTSRAYLSCAGFALLFLTGTALVVYNSVGRQAEQHDTVALQAQARNAVIEDKRADLENARQRLDTAEKNADRERGSKCKQRCKDWEAAATDARRVIGVLESEIKALGAPVPVDAKAGKAGQLAAVFGFDRAKAENVAALIEPFLWTIFFEIGSIVSLGFAFRSRSLTLAAPASPGQLREGAQSATASPTASLPVPAEPSDVSAQSDFPALPNGSAGNVVALFGPLPDIPNGSPNGSGGPKGGRRTVRPDTKPNDRKADVLADIQARIDRGERFESQEALRQALSGRFGNIPKSTLSEWLAELSDSISRRQDGRRKVVSS